MKIRSSDRAPPGRAAGLVGTSAVHAAAISFLFTTVKPTKASPPSYAVDLVAAPAPSTEAAGARGTPDSASGGEAAAGPAQDGAAPEKPAPVTPQPPKPKPRPARSLPTGRSRTGAVAEDGCAGHAGPGRNTEHRQRCRDDQDAGAGVSVSRSICGTS